MNKNNGAFKALKNSERDAERWLEKVGKEGRWCIDDEYDDGDGDGNDDDEDEDDVMMIMILGFHACIHTDDKHTSMDYKTRQKRKTFALMEEIAENINIHPLGE